MLSTLVSSMTFFEPSEWATFISAGPALILLLFFCLLGALEARFAGKKPSAKQLRRSYQTNLGLFVFNSAIMSLLSVSSLMMLAQRYSDQGLLGYIRSPLVKAVLSFLLLDALLYFWHKACHRFDGLWLFHKVHHNDPYLNVSTAFRIHILELLMTTVLKSAFIIAFGIDKTMLLVYETLYPFFILFHHANISFKAESRLGWIVVVPALHRVHHSAQRSEHDRNYGAVFSIWDRLFGTLIELEPVEIGLQGDSPQTFFKLIRFGFVMSDTPAVDPVTSLDAMIAEAAYYKAEKRNFSPGNELRDWLEAKREIISLVYGDKALKKLQEHKVCRFFKFGYRPLNRQILAGRARM